MAKGSKFERTICKQLSKWWTLGERDDVFWRSSISGGRATQRAKKGLRTYGSYGDIAAVDPIGEPLLKLFTIELKRGSSHKSPGDLLDFKSDNQCHPWVKCLAQTMRSAIQARSLGWMLICRRDCRQAMVYIDTQTAGELNVTCREGGRRGFLGEPMVTRFHLACGKESVRFVGLQLRTFLARVHPKDVSKTVNDLT